MFTTLTSEAVSKGHPDKLADQISDAILDTYLMHDDDAHVAVETLLDGQNVTVAGEVATSAKITHRQLASTVKRAIRDAGYTRKASPDYNDTTVNITMRIRPQSPEINKAVNSPLQGRGLLDVQGAGDQGIVYGYATNETRNLMPLPLHLARVIIINIEALAATSKRILPDAKAQVTVHYDELGKPDRVSDIVASVQHAKSFPVEELRNIIYSKVIVPVIEREVSPLIDTSSMDVLINPGGTFTLGGPLADTGLTGRKITVDTYGGAAPHGGGAYSGKDASKVDRSGALAARWAAVNIVEAGLADRATVQVAYAIGVANPVMIDVDTDGTSQVPDRILAQAVSQVFDFTPQGIHNTLRLNSYFWQALAEHGPYGLHDGSVSPDNPCEWERPTRRDELVQAVEGLL